jgi:hypothetical protein
MPKPCTQIRFGGLKNRLVRRPCGSTDYASLDLHAKVGHAIRKTDSESRIGSPPPTIEFGYQPSSIIPASARAALSHLEFAVDCKLASTAWVRAIIISAPIGGTFPERKGLSENGQLLSKESRCIDASDSVTAAGDMPFLAFSELTVKMEPENISEHCAQSLLRYYRGLS